MKDTFKLYRCSPLRWADLLYEEALTTRRDQAKKAMNYYRKKASKIQYKMSNKKYDLLVDCYKNSDEARKWNQIFLDEIKKKREKRENKNSKIKKNVISS